MLMFRVIMLCLILVPNIVSGASNNTAWSYLMDTERPFPVRQEMAINLLSLLQFESEDLSRQITIVDEAGLKSLHDHLEYLDGKSQTLNPENVSSPAQHYLTLVLVKMDILYSLDFSDKALRHFFQINSKMYDCKPRATVAEFFVPNSYLLDRDTTKSLEEITQKLQTEIFQKVAHDVTSRFTTPSISPAKVVKLQDCGQDRFALYQQAYQDAKAGKRGQPYKSKGGYIFADVTDILSDNTDCYLYYKSRIVQDYGREWFRKTYADTLTTMTRQLDHQKHPITTATLATDVVLKVASHSVTRQEMRDTMALLIGNETTNAFWESVQRQALEAELIYHGSPGRTVRESEAFSRLSSIMLLINDAARQIDIKVKEQLTTETIHAYYLSNLQNYTTISNVRFILFQCETPEASPDSSRCAGILEQVRSGKETSGLTDVTSQTVECHWETLSREAQIATQDIKQEQWSTVFTEKGAPRVLKMLSIERSHLPLDQNLTLVTSDLIEHLRSKYWRKFIGLK